MSMRFSSPHRRSLHPLRLHASAARRDQGGFTLVEILIAVLVLSFGLLGLAMLQATGLKYNTDSYMRTQATLAAYSIMDRIRANRVAADTGTDYVASAAPATAETCGDSVSGCGSAAALANYDLTQWYDLQSKTLAAGSQASQITHDLVASTGGKSVHQYHITVRWSEHGTQLQQTWELQLCQLADHC